MVRISHMATALAATLLTWTNAHPGEHIDPVVAQREADLNKLIAARGAQKLGKCSTSPRARALQQRAIARRAASVHALKPVSKRSIDEIKKYEQVKHNFTGSLSQHSSLNELFAKDTSSILMPEEILGPYWISGETMRKNCTEGQPGIPMTFELQFIDVNTCEPVPGLWIDVWSANATGDYSGIDDHLDTTFLRGVQISDEDGVTTFNSLVPGHYSGRATHTHVLVHGNVTTFANGTYTSGITRHVGQLYYDEGLRAAAEAVAPYTTNTVEITSNINDTVLPTDDLGDFDPFFNYVYLTDDIADGIFAWHSVGIDMRANYTSMVSEYGHLYQTGGVKNEDSGMGGPPAGDAAGGGAPTGTAPSGAAPSNQ